jgi:hypothetical protein
MYYALSDGAAAQRPPRSSAGEPIPAAHLGMALPFYAGRPCKDENLNRKFAKFVADMRGLPVRNGRGLRIYPDLYPDLVTLSMEFFHS